MKLNEKERVQFIVLCCLIVFVLAFFGYRMMNTGSNPASETSSSAKPRLHSDQVALNDTQEPNGYILPITGKGRDPFAPQMFPQEIVKPVIQQVQPKPIYNTQMGMMPVIPAGVRPIAPLPPNNGAPQAQTIEVPDPAEKLVLVGIITGVTNVAVIHGEGNTRFIVKEGQSIDGMFTVESISKNGVRIKSQKSTIVLKLGGNNAVQNRARS